MAFTKIVLVLVCLMSTTLVAQEAKVAPLMSKDWSKQMASVKRRINV